MTHTLNTQKKPGPDGIYGHEGIVLTNVFTDIFNLSLNLGVISTCVKQTNIIPVPKTSAVSCLNDYNPQG